ncbi:MAG: flavin reductase family protein [Geminicoccaceae bacterium]
MTALGSRPLRDAFGSFITGVTVVTTVDGSGQPLGFTANSFSSVSLDPPLLLVCPGRFLTSFSVFEACSAFAVSVLAEGQEDISNTFASFKGDRFREVAWSPDVHGVPVIDGAAAHFSCKTSKVIPAGDHVVLIGAVQDYACSDATGLGYVGGQYFSIGLERRAHAAPKPGHPAIVGAIVEYDGQVMLETTEQGLRLPHLRIGDTSHVRHALDEYLVGRGLEAALGSAYSIFEDRASGIRHTFFRARAANGETGGLGTFMLIADVTGASFVSKGQASMMARYALEYETQDFGLYVGDESGGDVHSLQREE